MRVVVHRVLTAGLLVALPATGRGQPPPDPTPTAADPLAWVAAGGALAATFLLDLEARDEIYLENGEEFRGLAELGNAFGTPKVLGPAIGGAYLAGRLLDRPGLSRGALDAVAGLAVSLAATQVLKVAVGRPRPYVPGTDGDELRPLTLNGDYHSFPSGHTAAAFSLATTVAVETRRPWLATLAYGAAGLDAWARLHDDMHWLSDTAAGAFVGTVATRMALSRLHRGEGAKPAAPRLAVGPQGIALTVPAP